jgi:hypothetical protein
MKTAESCARAIGGLIKVRKLAQLKLFKDLHAVGTGADLKDWLHRY